MHVHIGDFPAIFQKQKEGYGVFFPDLPGTASYGKNYAHAVEMASECLSLHLEGMLEAQEEIPKPSHPDALNLKKDQLVVMIEGTIN